MFDNLKEKLGSFRKDAEAAAEENVEEVPEDELDEDVEAGPDEPADESAVSDAAPDESADEGAVSDTDRTGDEETADSAATESIEHDDSTGDADTGAIDSTGSEAEADRVDSPAETDTVPSDASGTAPVEETDSPATESAESIEPEPDTETDADEVDAEPETDDESEPAAESSGSDTETPPPVEQRSSPMTGSPMTGSSSTTETGGENGAADESAADGEAADAAGDGETGAEDDTGFGRKAKSLVRGKFVIEDGDLEGPLHELELALLSSDVEMGVAEEILDNIRDELIGETRTFTTSTGQVVEEALRDAIYDVISVGQFDFDERVAIEDKPVTIVFTGVNGVGKTTSIAKLSRYFEERGYSTVMANGDTYRAGATEQIQEHANALDTKCISHQQGGDPAAVLYDAVEYAEANEIDIVLGDTAGRLHTDEGLMDQLEKIGRVVDPEMTLFVDEAVAGQDAVNRAREFNEAVEMDGAILTKADADSNGGAAISIAHVTGKPILFLGTGQGYDDIERFDPEEMADRLLADE